MRMFIALCFSSTALQKIHHIQKELLRHGVQGRFSPVENLHLTLAFLGNQKDLSSVDNAIKTMETDAEPFLLKGDSISTFSFSRSSTIVLTPQKNKSLEVLVRDLRASLKKNHIYFDPKPFLSHITLVRQAVLQSLPELDLNDLQEEITSFCLMSSELKPGKNPVYTILKRYPL